MRNHPPWLKKSLVTGDDFYRTKEALARSGAKTVCEHSRCPNMHECFSRSFATFLILGTRCTRDCAYCSVEKHGAVIPDPEEPSRIASAAKELRLEYAVVTSVTRDDLPGGGSAQFALTVEALRAACPHIMIELLIPDFGGDLDAVARIVRTGARVIGHNIETVRRLYPGLRPQADYDRSLSLLRFIKDTDRSRLTKSGIMVGLGEAEDEVIAAMEDVKKSGCDMLTIGQYLSPDSAANASVREFVPPDRFRRYEAVGRSMGFKNISCGPFVRSSYMAEESYHKAKESIYGECSAAAVS